jgi:hypothetical protein
MRSHGLRVAPNALSFRPRSAVHVALTILVLASMPRVTADEPKPTAKLDLAYIPHEAYAAVVVHPQRLLTAPELEFLPIEVLSAQAVKTLGVDPLDIQQVVAFSTPRLLGVMPEYGVIARFTKPYDRTKLLPDLLSSAEEVRTEGKTWWTPPGGLPSVYLPDDRTVVVAPAAVLKKMILAKGADSPLLRRLSQADISHHLTLVTSVEMIREELKKQFESLGKLPEPFGELTKLVDHVVATEVRIDAALPLRQETIVFGHDAAGLDEIERLLKLGLKVGRELLLTQQAQAFATLDKGDPVQQAFAKYGQRMTNGLFDSIQISRREKQMAVSVSGMGGVATSGVGVALLLPAVQAAREAGRRAQSSNNLKQIALAVHNYHDTYNRLPRQAIYDKAGKKKLLSWRVQLLPFMEQKALYDKFKLDEPWDSEHNKKLIPLMPAVFKNPNRPADDYKTTYLAPVGKGTIFGAGRELTFGSITDGTSNTLLFVEANNDKAVIWTQPDDLEVSEKDPLAGLGGVRPQVFLAARGDASVTALRTSIKPKTLWAMFTYAGAEDVDDRE